MRRRAATAGGARGGSGSNRDKGRRAGEGGAGAPFTRGGVPHHDAGRRCGRCACTAAEAPSACGLGCGWVGDKMHGCRCPTARTRTSTPDLPKPYDVSALPQSAYAVPSWHQAVRDSTPAILACPYAFLQPLRKP